MAYRPCLPGSMFATVLTLTHTWEFLGDQFRVHVRPNRRTPKLCMAYSKGHWPRNIANFLRGQEIPRKIKQTIKRSVYALHHLFSMPWAWLWCQRNIDTREKGAIFKPSIPYRYINIESDHSIPLRPWPAESWHSWFEINHIQKIKKIIKISCVKNISKYQEISGFLKTAY